MQKTRQRILDYLQHNHSATCLDLSRGFGQTPANLRHHLRILQQQGQIQPIGQRPSNGRGRPETLFALSSPSVTSTMDRLASHLLNLQSQSDHAVLMRQLAQQLFQQPKVIRGSLTQRLVDIVQRFEHLDYQPSWEATPQGPHIHLMRCPFAAIIQDHPELCRMDAAALELALDQPVTQTRKLEADAEGLPYCSFMPSNQIT